MAERTPLVVVAGDKKRLPPADTLPPRITRSSVIRLSSSVNQSAATGWAVLPWTTVARDPDSVGGWSAGAPTRWTVPAGVTEVRIRASVVFAAGAGVRRAVQVRKGGVEFAGEGTSRFPNQSSAAIFAQCVTARLPVTAGDYFETFVEQESGVALDVLSHNSTWMEIEVIA